MRRVVVLDSGPLGRVANPLATPENDLCSLWLEELLLSGVLVVIPEIADYEVRCELLRANKPESIKVLDALQSTNLA